MITKTYYGQTLPYIDRVVGGHECISVPGIGWVYVSAAGGVPTGFRRVRGEDYEGNVVHRARLAPCLRDGIASRIHGRPVKAVYLDPVCYFR